MTQRVPFRDACEEPEARHATSAVEFLRAELERTGTRRKNECPAPLVRLLADLCERRAQEAAADRDGARPTAEEMRWLRWRSWLNDVADRVEREMPGRLPRSGPQRESAAPTRFPAPARSRRPQQPVRIAAGSSR
jgi:hypothetical protein